MQAGISLYQMSENLEEGDYAGAAKNGLDIAIGAIGVWGGPVGAGIAAVYFIGDAFDWW